MAEISPKTILKKYEVLGRFSPLRENRTGSKKNRFIIPWKTTQRTLIPNFMEIQHYLGTEKIETKMVGRIGRRR